MSPDMREQIAQLQAAIAAQEGLRPALGDAAVDLAISALRRQLAELQAQARPADEERRQVSVLFADLSGFTALSEALDPEDVGDLIRTLWDRLDDTILSHGGTIDKHYGDAVMALWGAEQAHEDDPERAIRAALAMRDDLAALSRESGIPLAMRIGLHTGLVFLSELATTHELMAIGDTVNTAYRLQTAAPANSILISHDTYRQVRGVFDVQPLLPLTVKGKAEPLQTYSVLRAKPRAFRMATRGVEGIETRMVGRDIELRMLQQALRETIDQVRTHVVTVVGEAGVGKSRLLYEFNRWAELLPEEITYFKGRATPVMQAVPYGTIRDMFVYRFDIRETDPTAHALAKFRRGMADALPSEQADLVGHLVGFDFSASAAVQNLLGSPSFRPLAQAYLAHYVRTVAQKPTVMFLEDIHWADASSLDLVEHIIAEVPAARLLVVSLARPGLYEHRPQWGQPAPGAGAGYRAARTQIALQPLPTQESIALVHEILHKVDVLPPDFCHMIVAGAEGNPYFIEELIKMLIDGGIIVRGEAQWHVLPDYEARTRIPATLTGILQARLDALSHEEKGTLQRASVIGRRFWDGAVAEIGEAASRPARQGDELVNTAVHATLAALREKEFVFPQKDSAFSGTAEYLFKHALLRDVTYETVLLRLRRTYHARTAAWLEAHAGDRLDEYLSLIAEHYTLAGEKDKAADYLQRAGEGKYKVSAFREALAAFERALELRERDSAHYLALLVRIGYVLCMLSDYLPAQQRLQEALALARAINDRQTESAALSGIGWTLMGQGRYDETGPYFRPALQIAEEVGDRAGAAVILYHLGDIAYRQGDSEAAERYAGASLAMYQELGDHQGMVEAERVLGYATMARGRYKEAEDHHGQSLAISREIGDRRGLASALINLGETVRRQGRFRESLQYYQESLPIEIEVGNRRGEAIALLNQGHTYSALGEDGQAWDYFRQAIDVSLVVGLGAVLAEALAGIALLQAKAGRFDDAAELLGFLRAHPAWNAEVDEAAQPALAILQQEMAPEQLAALQARGQAQPQDAVIGKVMAAA